MSILKFLGLQQDRSDERSGETESVRKIVEKLESLDPHKARYIAAFAYILGRVANADLEISKAETRAMEETVQKLGHLPEEQAILVVQIAKSQHRLFGGTENFLVTREFLELSDVDQRQKLLDCLFAVSAADESISGVEEAQIRQIASELGFSHRQFVEARAAYSDHREVLKPLRDAD
ncbi:MAG: TerB family tellurite resistance protein [Acidobacteriota bacterium]